MLQKLKYNDYCKVTPIFNELKNQIVIGSVIEGNTPGDIYVDNINNPSFVVLWDKMGEILIEGKFNDQHLNLFTRLLTKTFIPDAVSRGFPLFDIFYPNEKWSPKIAEKLIDLSLRKELKYYFELDKLQTQRNAENDCVLIRIDNDLLSNKKLVNLDRVIGWINSFWYSPKEFINKGIGYCLINKDIIVSWCLTVFVSKQKYELALETDENYQGRGYAKIVAYECVKECIRNDYVPLWNCNASNEASAHVAEAVGFKKVKEYYIYRLLLEQMP